MLSLGTWIGFFLTKILLIQIGNYKYVLLPVVGTSLFSHRIEAILYTIQIITIKHNFSC